MRARIVIGLMTGTSIDGVDGAAVRLEGAGLGVRATVLAHEGAALGDLAPALRALASGGGTTAGDLAGLALRFGERNADVAAALAARVGPIEFVAAHGQTVHHRPPVSLQLLNPWPIVRRVGRPVVFDLRGADLAAGGQGAPITPLADWVTLRDERESRLVLNLGGFCNATLVPAREGRDDESWAGAVRGMDVCACNQALDACARSALGRAFDEGGAAAGAGRVDGAGAADLRGRLEAQAVGGRSLGSGDELGAWVGAWSERLSPNDLCATVAAAVGEAIGERARALGGGRARLLAAGGGARNAALVGAIARAAGARVETTDALGLPIDAREAAAMAVLGGLCADGAPITLPSITGASPPAPLSGSWAGTRPASTWSE